jgi:membrane-bound lytic murein transglycosylase D
MARMRLDKLVRRWFPVVACAPLILLAGCPQENAAAPGKAPAQATAPAAGGATAAADGTKPAPPPSTPAQKAEAAANARKAQQLISRTEATYRSGVEDYRAGKLDAARQQFDLAVDTMLTSGLDLKSDPQLADEFDRLLNSVNALEMDALKQGNGFSPAVEAAPLDAADEVTFPVNPELTAKLNAELKTTQSDFPLVVNDYVAGWISYFTNSKAGHAHLLRSLERAGKYKDMISKDLRDAGVPQDLIYLAVAESGFQPQVVNPSGAGGMWQFMPNGSYGLARNGWFDERFDPEKSSKAYARYMKELYNQFGDWYLAMAAYNWGPGNVQRAVMRTGYADFWELYRRNALPTETKNYVPGIIAAVIMAKNPHQYGLDNLVPELPVVSDTVTVDYAVDLRLVADVTDARLDELVALNPSLLRMRTPDQIPFDLHLPVGTRDVFLARMKTIPEEKRSSWRFHTVKPGESLGEIATSFHARMADIAETNQIGVTDPVDPGDELVIPIATSASGSHPQFYTVKRGDTLVTVADRFSVSVEDLRKWNHLKVSAVGLGRRLQVSQPVQLATSLRVRGRGRRATRTLHASTAEVSRSSAADARGSKARGSKSRGSRESKGDLQRARSSPSSRGARVEKASSHAASAASK